MSKLQQTKIPVQLEDLVNMLTPEPQLNWKLVRERDGLTKRSADVMWLEFNE